MSSETESNRRPYQLANNMYTSTRKLKSKAQEEKDRYSQLQKELENLEKAKQKLEKQEKEKTGALHTKRALRAMRKSLLTPLETSYPAEEPTEDENERVYSANQNTYVRSQETFVPFRGRTTWRPAIYPDWNQYSINTTTGERVYHHLAILPCSTVLTLPTIWQHDWQFNKSVVYSAAGVSMPGMGEYLRLPDDTQRTALVAPFPSANEEKFEGEDRLKNETHYGRYMPVPRLKGNDTEHWQLLKFLPQHELDKVRPVPHEVDVFMQEHDIGWDSGEGLNITEVDVAHWIGGNLMDAIDGDQWAH